MENPLAATGYSDSTDMALVQASLGGDRKALETLILRHQPFIYNVALKMTMDPQGADDITQEVLLKAITSISQFQGKSAFRTWLYRIAFNHVLNMQARPQERMFASFEGFGDFLDAVPDSELTHEEALVMKDTVEEVKLSCMSGMLLCLDREQRLVYLLGEVFGVDHNMAGELLEISPDNFRQRLSRARRDLYNFMHNRCGLVDKANPCRCPKKTRGLVQMGIVDPKQLKFNVHWLQRVREVAPDRAERMLNTYEDIGRDLFRDHPFHASASSQRIVQDILDNGALREIFNLP
jgi:RNA polymerase sigma factor (sigma-70 family)